MPRTGLLKVQSKIIQMFISLLKEIYINPLTCVNYVLTLLLLKLNSLCAFPHLLSDSREPYLQMSFPTWPSSEQALPLRQSSLPLLLHKATYEWFVSSKIWMKVYVSLFFSLVGYSLQQWAVSVSCSAAYKHYNLSIKLLSLIRQQMCSRRLTDTCFETKTLICILLQATKTPYTNDPNMFSYFWNKWLTVNLHVR